MQYRLECFGWDKLMLSMDQAGLSYKYYNAATSHRHLPVGCWILISLQHLRSYKDQNQLVTVHTDGDFMVLPHWEIRPPKP